ncbi:MAG: mevalonate kinase [Bacteriovoracia bacterium]
MILASDTFRTAESNVDRGLLASQVTVPGKWVLTGEHTVLRGGSAIAMPHPEYSLTLSFEADGAGELKVGRSGRDHIYSPVLELVRQLERKSGAKAPGGTLRIQSTIPVGGGLGSSAALCVAVTRWFSARTGYAFEKPVAVATELEDYFHGKSSGMDVAVVASGQPIVYRRTTEPGEVGITPLLLASGLPKFTFHDTRVRGRTSDCIEKVKRVAELDPARGEALDRQMKAATAEAIEGLQLFGRGGSEDRARGLERVASAMSQGQGCYEGWGLVPDSVSALHAELKRQGALATKLTGAGGGGFLVALWD